MKKLGAFMVLCCALTGCSPQGFQDYSSTEGKFDVKFPAGSIKSQDQTIAGGIKQTMVGVERRDGAFQVFFQELPFGPQATGDQAIDLVAKQMDGKVLYRGDWEHGGAKGREFEVQIAKPLAGYLCTRMIVVNNRLYQLQAIGTNYRRDNADVQKFWNSFKLKS